MAAEEIGAATRAADVECSRCDEEDDDQEIANDSRAADGI